VTLYQLQKEPSIAIIVLNWNGFNDTIKCMESLKKLSYKNYKIVLVDNGSDNNEGGRLKEKYPDIHLIQNEINKGFAGGNNDGINWAFGNNFEYIVNLNNDCIVEEIWLSNLVNGLKSTNANFASSRIMFCQDPNIICSDGDIMFPDGSAVCENRYKKYNRVESKRKIFSACGAGSIYSVKCLKDVMIKNNQIFDELYFVFYEDIDLAIRLNLKSYEGVFIPNAVIYHKHSATAGMYSELKVFHSEKNRILNEILNFPVYLIFLGELVFALKIFLLLVYSIFNKKSKGYRYLKNLGIIDIALLFLKARIWVISNFPLVVKDRHERKTSGYISNRIIKFFCWNFLNMIS